MIEFHDVTVCYEPQKRHPVRSLDGLNLKIERGDWVFLVGPSGAGKSSLLKLIFAGTRPQSGSITVDGQEIFGITAKEIPALRRKIGIVFQDFQLLNEKTAWENVAFTLRVIGAPQSVIVREVPRALETVGLTHRAEAFPHELSGGEQQRIAIARAIVNDPKILLADEPTGNLDPNTAREVGELLTRINRERGTTIVMATHDGAFVNELKRRVVRLKAGRVVSDLNPGTYSEGEELSGEVTPFDAVLPMTSPRPAPRPTPVVEKPAPAPQPVVVKAPPVREEPEPLPPVLLSPDPEVPAPPVEPLPPLPVPEPAPAPAPAPEIPVEIPRPVPAPQPVTPPQPIEPPVAPPEPEVQVYIEPPVVTPPAPEPVVYIPPAPERPAPGVSFDDFPAPRPMARRIAPPIAPPPRSSEPAPDPYNPQNQ